ncbi:MAG TPA: hypothetical protein VJS44_21500 [Pyrinomonadaceae bacterium]|nr:hypothetical protein [Pyrinomonadaceae bacterium]
MRYRTPLLIICLLVLVTATLASFNVSVRPQPAMATASAPARPLEIEEEEYAVYSVMINDALKEGREQEKRKDAAERVLIINDNPSLWQGFVADESKTFFEELKNSSPELEPETLNDLQIKGKETQRLERKFSLNIKYIIVKDEEIEALFKDNVMGGWEAFHRKYPKSSGILSLSRVGFNSDKTQAIVYKGWSCGGLCGGGGYILLKKKKGVWVVGPGIGPTWVS